MVARDRTRSAGRRPNARAVTARDVSCRGAVATSAAFAGLSADVATVLDADPRRVRAVSDSAGADRPATVDGLLTRALAAS